MMVKLFGTHELKDDCAKGFDIEGKRLFAVRKTVKFTSIGIAARIWVRRLNGKKTSFSTETTPSFSAQLTVLYFR